MVKLPILSGVRFDVGLRRHIRVCDKVFESSRVGGGKGSELRCNHLFDLRVWRIWVRIGQELSKTENGLTEWEEIEMIDVFKDLVNN